ncbi:putative sulfate exporter family transporter [Aquisphaera insulae]|uniref:putative sulfate exporter family transporter n=1 Tax=Aquisphaera insulae TaxID=2712864 RepID=UPI00203085CD|nr:putative sulfate exporter family transporter [Aquisphaera insulae]
MAGERSWFISEDWLAVWLGAVLVLLAMPAAAGHDLLGWIAAPQVWLDPTAAIKPVSKAYAGVAPALSALLTFSFVATLVGVGAKVLGYDPRRFLPRFAVLYALSALCWVAGHNAYIAATPNQRPGFGISWSLGLTGEAGFLVALGAGLAVSNLLPGLAAWLSAAARPEWFIKTAIVIFGAAMGAKAADAAGLMSAIMFRGLAAIIEAYLIYWALVYLLARTVFGFSREWAAPLASGISICGVSAAITTGAAIRARPVVPIMVSSLVVVFSVVELLILPLAAREFLWREPLVAAAWMGLAVKTDGAALASGTITESLIRAKAQGAGLVWDPGWMLNTTATVKIFIDVFIGVWALVLAVVWAYGIDRKPGAGVPLRDILRRFPAFVIGYFALFLATLLIALRWPGTIAGLKAATAEVDPLRGLFFALTFFTIGLATNLRKLWAEGIGRLAVVYAVSLFGFILWIGLAISWLFFHGAMPPTTPGGHGG